MFVYRSEKGGFSSLQPKPEKELQRSASRYILWVFHTAVRSSPVYFIIHKCRENPNNSGKNHKCFTLSSLKQVLVTILPRDAAVKQTQSTRRVWQSWVQERLQQWSPAQGLEPGPTASAPLTSLCRVPRQDLEHCWSSAGTGLPKLCHTQGIIQPPGDFTASLMSFWHSGNGFPVISCCTDWIVSSSPDWHATQRSCLK